MSFQPYFETVRVAAGHTGYRSCVACVICLFSLVLLGGCATEPGILFPQAATMPAWPPPPETARIVWVGQLMTDRDLKPGVNGMEAVGQAIFGKHDPRAMGSPYALCTDGGKDGGRLFVADSNAHVVHMFDLATRKYQTWKPGKKAPPLNIPVGVAWDAGPAETSGAGAGDQNGRLLVSDSAAGVIFVFDSTGKYIGQLGAGILQRPCGLALEPGTRRIVIADAKAHQIVVLDPDGREVARIGSRGTRLGEFNFPTTVAFDTQGQLFVCDTLNFRVQQFDRAYKPVRIVGKKGDMPGYFAQPKAIALDAEDHLYVLDSQFENVQLFDSQGRPLMDFGEEGSGPGQFWLPTGIFIERGAAGTARIWLADSFNGRIQVFDYKPAPTEVQR
ncbi:MAG: 6-bladed beta-propeller [Phycisphaerae bacterium]